VHRSPSQGQRQRQFKVRRSPSQGQRQRHSKSAAAHLRGSGSSSSKGAPQRQQQQFIYSRTRDEGPVVPRSPRTTPAPPFLKAQSHHWACRERAKESAEPPLGLSRARISASHHWATQRASSAQQQCASSAQKQCAKAARKSALAPSRASKRPHLLKPHPLSCMQQHGGDSTSGQDLRQLREASEPSKARSAKGVASDSRRHARATYLKLADSTRAERG
jgi:hypothetical protein